MQKKTADLAGRALDWAVSYARRDLFQPVAYSTDWQFGGPLIEWEDISITATGFPWWECETGWYAHIGGDLYAHGGTPLVAAMRVFVMSKLGETVDVPEELNND